MDAGEWINTASVALAAISFVWGVRSWRTSYVGQRQIELVEQVYELFLTCADHINAIRDPFGYSSEGSTRQAGPNETPEQKELYDRAFVAIERMEARKDSFNKLFALQPRFDLYFGDGSSDPIRELADFMGEIRRASNALRVHWTKQGTAFPSEAAFEKHLERMHKAEAVFWDSFDDDDPIRDRLRSATNKMKRTCNHAINPRQNIWDCGRRGLLWLEHLVKIPKNNE